MSHFTVAVITATKPTQEHLASALAPWHEFECTGIDDEHVKDVDKTAEMRASYETDTCRRIKGPDGALHHSYDDRFYRDPTEEESAKIGKFAGTGAGHGMSWTSRDWGDGSGYRTKVHYVPDGHEEVELPYLHAMSFREYVAYETSEEMEVPFGAAPDLSGKHKYGYTILAVDGSVVRVIDRTNPDKKWDWWLLGGRWTGMLKLLPGCGGALGKPGTLTDPAEPGFVDSAALGDIDVEGMREKDAREAGERWDRFRAIVGLDTTWRSWSEVRESGLDIGAAREAYHAQDALLRLHASGARGFDFDVDDFLISRDAYVQDARDGAGATFAVVKDGVWYERGEMGWWGCVSNETDKADWNKRFAELLDGLPPTAWLSIVDCHI